MLLDIVKQPVGHLLLVRVRGECCRVQPGQLLFPDGPQVPLPYVLLPARELVAVDPGDAGERRPEVAQLSAAAQLLLHALGQEESTPQRLQHAPVCLAVRVLAQDLCDQAAQVTQRQPHALVRLVACALLAVQLREDLRQTLLHLAVRQVPGPDVHGHVLRDPLHVLLPIPALVRLPPALDLLHPLQQLDRFFSARHGPVQPFLPDVTAV